MFKQPSWVNRAGHWWLIQALKAIPLLIAALLFGYLLFTARFDSMEMDDFIAISFYLWAWGLGASVVIHFLCRLLMWFVNSNDANPS